MEKKVIDVHMKYDAKKNSATKRSKPSLFFNNPSNSHVVTFISHLSFNHEGLEEKYKLQFQKLLGKLKNWHIPIPSRSFQKQLIFIKVWLFIFMERKEKKEGKKTSLCYLGNFISSHFRLETRFSNKGGKLVRFQRYFISDTKDIL